MAERNAACEEGDLVQTSRMFEAELTRIKRDIQNLFNRLHVLLDKRKDALLAELKQIKTIQDNNKEAEHAIRQLERAMEGLVSTISSNLLREKKEQYSESLTRDIAEYRNKIQVCPNMETCQVLYNGEKFEAAMRSVEIKHERLTVQEGPRLLAGQQGDLGDLRRARGVSVCPVTNTIFIADRYNSCIKSFSMEGVFLQDIGAGGQLNSPWGVSVCEDALYVTEVGPKQIYKFRVSGELVKKSGGKGKREGEFANARGVCATQEAVYVCDKENNRVQVLTADLNCVSIISNPGLKSPVDVQVKNREITVLPLNDNKVFVFGQEGGLTRTVILDEQHLVREKYFFTIDRKGAFLISSRLDGCLKVFSLNGKFQREVGRGWAEDCYGVCMAGNGDEVVCVCGNSEKGSLQVY